MVLSDDLRTREVTGTRADARDMAIVHQFYRREFDLAPRILRDLRPEQDARRAAVEEWFDVGEG